METRDELFEDAARIIVMEQNPSGSVIQCRLRLGYNRAGRILDQLTEAGILSGEVGERKVNFKTEKELCEFLKIEYVEPPILDDCITEKCTYPNCKCPDERLGIITAGELNRKGISNKWLRILAEVQDFYGDISKHPETQEQFLRRLQKEIKL